jgi:hypothetical protein
VPYHKGALFLQALEAEVGRERCDAFLRRLEQVFGRERLDEFLRAWFDEHAFQSVTTATFLAFLDARLLKQAPALAAQVDVASWVNGAGLPADAPVPDSVLFEAVDSQLARWRTGTPPGELTTKGWTTQQWQRFLGGLGKLQPAQLAELDAAFQFTRSGNSEILCKWLEIAVRSDYHAVDRRLELFLMTVGRRKFLKPLYEALLAAPDGKARALAIYGKARPRYHAVSQRTLDSLLGYSGS